MKGEMIGYAEKQMDIAINAYGKWKPYFQSSPSFAKEATTELFRPQCHSFLGTPEYKKGMSYKYKICCELLELCSFYHQSWFIYACAGAGAFLAIGIVAIMILVFICTRKRGGKSTKGKSSGDQKKRGAFKSKSGKGSKSQGTSKKSSKNKISKKKK